MEKKIYDLNVTNGNEKSCCNAELLKQEGDVYYYKFTYTSEEYGEAAPVTMEWLVDCIDIFSTWNPMTRFDKALRTTYTAGIDNDTRYNFSAPVQSLISKDGKSRMTVALSDAVSPIRITTQIDEPTMRMRCRVQFFSSYNKPIKDYEAIVRIDLTDMKYYDALSEVEKWWREDCGYKTAYVPEAAKRLFYSTWYSYHRNIKDYELLEECRMAKKMGMEGIIVDAGWEYPYEDTKRNPFYGNWRVIDTKFKDMAEFVEEVHKIGMKVMLWYSVPYIGEKSDLWKRFGEYVLDDKTNGIKCLDMRYKEVRDFLTETWANAIKNWKLDGVKLDFVDSIALSEYSMRKDERRDFESIFDATHALLLEATNRLREINPEVMLEFRQAYVGPAARMSGNILRVSDCPNDAVFNRVGAVDLRLLSGNTAIHSDMIGWHLNDTPQECARQLMASMFCVPQISVKIEELNEEQKNVLEFYCKIWNEYRDVLLNGKIIPYEPEFNYTQVKGKLKDKAAAVCYSKNYITEKECYNDYLIVNGTDETAVILHSEADDYEVMIEIYDCDGTLVSKEETMIIKGINLIPIPTCGMAKIIKLG